VVLVVGVVLLVVLAAVVSSFVLGVGSEGGAPEAPQVSMDFEYDDTTEAVTVTHAGGDSIDAAALTVVVDGQQFAWNGTDADGRVSAGSSTTVSAQRGATVRVVWADESTETLAEYEIPA
jgi:FlaG/FlaF family flagellin (archaellin)